jgi:hypothetical protein
MAATHRGDDERKAFRKQETIAVDVAFVGLVLFVTSLIVMFVGGARNSDALIVTGAVGLIISVALYFVPLNVSDQCPVCEAQVSSRARFCTACGAQLRS